MIKLIEQEEEVVKRVRKAEDEVNLVDERAAKDDLSLSDARFASSSSTGRTHQ